jgi:hypothetical protein
MYASSEINTDLLATETQKTIRSPGVYNGHATVKPSEHTLCTRHLWLPGPHMRLHCRFAYIKR